MPSFYLNSAVALNIRPEKWIAINAGDQSVPESNASEERPSVAKSDACNNVSVDTNGTFWKSEQEAERSLQQRKPSTVLFFSPRVDTSVH